MKLSRIVVSVVVIWLLESILGAAWAEPIEMPLPPAGSPLVTSSGICSDQQYIYVMAGGKIMRYGISDLALQESVDLPEPAVPTEAPIHNSDSGRLPPPPPMMAGPHGLWMGNDVLYVLAGPRVYLYSVPDLVLNSSIALPLPEFPDIEDE